MQVIISSLLLIFALHFLLQGINYRKSINLYKVKENLKEKPNKKKSKETTKKLEDFQEQNIKT